MSGLPAHGIMLHEFMATRRTCHLFPPACSNLIETLLALLGYWVIRLDNGRTAGSEQWHSLQMVSRPDPAPGRSRVTDSERCGPFPTVMVSSLWTIADGKPGQLPRKFRSS